MWFTALLPLFLTIISVQASSSLARRDPTDICASINTELVVPDLLGILTAVGVINTCLCESAVSLFIETNVVAILAVTIAGEAVTVNILNQLIVSASANQHCSYPDHSVPQCVNGNPCGFQCSDGFTSDATMTTCVCESPNIVCNGQCAPFPACPSSTPSKRQLRRGDERCSKGRTACGAYRGSLRQWDCVDTKSDLENCGGCAVPIHPLTPIGTDCSALPGIFDVSCVKGTCIISRCEMGYNLSWDRSSCIPSTMIVES